MQVAQSETILAWKEQRRSATGIHLYPPLKAETLAVPMPGSQQGEAWTGLGAAAVQANSDTIQSRTMETSALFGASPAAGIR